MTAKGTSMNRLIEILNRKSARGIKKEKGSVVIEATLSLSFFMFFVVLLLTIINMCIAQSKIGVALNESAKEFSEYGYLYSLTGFKKLQQTNYDLAEGAITDIDSAISGLEDAKEALDTIAGMPSSEDSWADMQSAEDSADSAAKKYETIYNNFKDNPGSYVIGLVRVAGNEGYEWFKGATGGAVVKGLMYKHLKKSSESDVDTYLSRLNVVDGIDGLDLGSSSIFTNGSDDITFVCKYKLRIFRLLETDFTFNMCQVAQTKAWSGQSLVRTPEEIEKSSGSEDPSDDSGDESSKGPTDEEDPGTSSDDGTTDEEKPDYDAIRQKMIDKYDEDIIAAIEDEFDTSNWTESDWEEHIALYKSSDNNSADESLLDENGKFKDPKLEADYQKYVQRKTKEGFAAG